MVKMCVAGKSVSFQIFGAIAVAAVVLATAALLTCHFIRKTGKDEYYPDLISVPASSCWEANVFATSKDPFYKWVTDTSIPSLLSKKSSTLSMALYAAAYQKMSVGRVSGKEISGKNISGKDLKDALYTAPDPRLMGGIISPHAKSWIWKMKMHWGIGIRRCLNNGMNEETTPMEACQQTAPVIPVLLNSTANAHHMIPDLASLHVQIPFNGSFSSGYYLANFVGTAKSNISLGVDRREVKVDASNLLSSKSKSTWYYFQDANVIKECEPQIPIYYLPDVVLDYAGQLYQCGCIPTGGCIIGKNLTSIANDLHLGKGCDKALSFWDTEVDLENGTTVLQTYNPHLDTSFAVSLQFNELNVTDAFGSKVTLVAPALGRITECVESWLNSFSSDPTDEELGNLPLACHHNKITVIWIQKLKMLGLDRDVEKIIIPLLNEEQNETELDCGLRSKLAEAPLCYRMLKDGPTAGIHRLLRDVLALAQVIRHGEKLWSDDSQKRSQVYLALLTSVMGLFGAMVGVLSKTITDLENAVLLNAPRYIVEPQSRFHRSLLRTVVRSLILLGSIVAFIISLFYSIKDIKKEREAATSETILHFDKKGAFLVTTTSTVEVEPNWIVYVIFTALVTLTLVPFSILIFFKVSSDEETQAKGHSVD